MVGEKVTHLMHGEGVIIESRESTNAFEKYITVRFATATKTFVFPTAFEKHLETENPEIKAIAASAIAKIKEIKDAETAKKIAAVKSEIVKTQLKTNYTNKMKAPSKLVVGNKLNRGVYYGTVAKKIYEDCCDKLGWDIGESGKFGMQQRLYSDIATPEWYSVWFLAHSNWMGESIEEAIEARAVFNKISETYMEQWWGKSNHPVATKRKRVLFAKKDGTYMFLGVYEFVGERREEKNRR